MDGAENIVVGYSATGTVAATDAHSIRFVGKDVIEAAKFLEFVTSYTIELEP